MKIAHFCPFAPHRCGMYETTREMLLAERRYGNRVELVDTGINGNRRINATDERDSNRPIITTSDYSDVVDYDLFVVHSNIPDSFLRRTTAPVIQILHGRPESSFRLSQQGAETPVYQIHSQHARNPRFRRFVTLWPEHVPYWDALIPSEKFSYVTNPPCDLDAFTPDGNAHEWDPAGKFNILVADLWRPDADPFHVAHGLLNASLTAPPFKAHFYACNTKLGPWEYVFRAMRKKNILGETRGMMFNIDRVYRAADLVVTIHPIATRIVRESLACGTPLLAPWPSIYTHHRYLPGSAREISDALNRAISAIHRNSTLERERARKMAENSFDLESFGTDMLNIYENVLAEKSKLHS